ncbi:MAG TPA: hypothetical protein VHR36_04425 [Pyrinomonadaceae bacterium]|nr:hypothetical protein [Pyrinomonadaceae bacterium]
MRTKLLTIMLGTLFFITVPRAALAQPSSQSLVEKNKIPVNSPVTSTVQMLPDLVITDVHTCSNPDAGKLLFAYQGQRKYDCYLLHLRNQGLADAVAGTLRVVYVIRDTHSKGLVWETATAVEAYDFPAIKRARDAWISIKALGSVIPYHYNSNIPSPSVPILVGYTAIIDPDNKISELDELNNQYHKSVHGVGSEDACDLRVGNGSKVFVVNNTIYANIVVVNYGANGTCAGLKSPSLSIYFYTRADSHTFATPPPVIIGSQTNSSPKDWGSTLNVFKFSCDAVCQQNCLSAENSKCGATVHILSGNTAKQDYFYLIFNQNYNGSLN